ncbi:MAG: hypothetical protein ACOCTT_04115 [archaeon]
MTKKKKEETSSSSKASKKKKSSKKVVKKTYSFPSLGESAEGKNKEEALKKIKNK